MHSCLLMEKNVLFLADPPPKLLLPLSSTTDISPLMSTSQHPLFCSHCPCLSRRHHCHSVSQAMVMAGIISHLKWRDLLNASPQSKQRLYVITRSHKHSTIDGSKIQVCFNAVYHYAEFLRRISTTSLIEVSYKLLRYYKNQCVHSRTQIGSRTRPIISDLHTQTLLHAQPLKVDGKTSISNTYWTLWDCVESYMMRTCLSSLFRTENTLKTNHNFLIESISSLHTTLSFINIKKASTFHIQAKCSGHIEFKTLRLLPSRLLITAGIL